MPDRRGRQRWHAVAALVAGSLLLAGVGWLVLLWAREGAGAADPRASVLGVLLAIGTALAALASWAWRKGRDAIAPMTAEQVAQTTETLAEVVLAQWQEEALIRSLADPEPMPVRWRLAPGSLMDHPALIAPDGLAIAGRSDRVEEFAAAFRRLTRRRLVIIGGPGTGKTTLALQLLVALLSDRREGEPVPVLFSLIDFEPEHRPLTRWLSVRLERDYPGLGSRVAKALVERSKILPVLDGLDEVPADRQAAIIASLNTALGTSGLILTSRRSTYRKAVADVGDVLTAAAVVAPLSLTRGDAMRYLSNRLAPNLADIDPARATAWSKALKDLTAGSAADFAQVVSTPLGLWLVRTVYIDDCRDPASLTDASHADRRRYKELGIHLLNELIPAVLRTRQPDSAVPRDAASTLRPARAYDPEDVRKWLALLAAQLQDGGSQDWLWWHLARHTFRTKLSRLTIRLVVALAISLPCGLIIEQMATLHVLLQITSPSGAVAFMLRYRFIDWSSVLAYAIPLAVIAAVLFRFSALPRRLDFRFRGRKLELMRKIALGFAFGILGAIITVALTLSGVMYLPTVMVFLVPSLCVLLGFANFLSSEGLAVRSTSPTASFRADRLRAILQVVSILALVSFSLFTLTTSEGSSWDILAQGTAPMVLVSLMAALLIGQAQVAFLTACTWLVLRRQLPWRLFQFLEDAHRLGLLRVVGPAYQFRHAELQDRLAPKRF